MTWPGQAHALDREHSGAIDHLRLEVRLSVALKCDVYYINTRLFTGNKWGTANPVTVRDPDFGVVRIRAFGTYDFRIVQPAAVPERSGGHRPKLSPGMSLPTPCARAS